MTSVNLEHTNKLGNDMVDYNREEMHRVLTDGFLNYVVQEQLPSVQHRTSAQQLELYRHSATVNMKVNVLVSGVMGLLDDNLKLEKPEL